MNCFCLIKANSKILLVRFYYSTPSCQEVFWGILNETMEGLNQGLNQTGKGINLGVYQSNVM